VYFAVDDLKSKVLIRLGAVELTEPNKVRSIELIDDGFYDAFLVNNRSLREDGNGGNEQGGHRRESDNGRLEHDEYFVMVVVYSLPLTRV
jgi:hypothetical protein